MHIPKSVFPTAVVAVALGLASPVLAQHRRGGGDGGHSSSSNRGSESHGQAMPRAAQPPASRPAQAPAPAPAPAQRSDNGARRDSWGGAQPRAQGAAVPRAYPSVRNGGAYRNGGNQNYGTIRESELRESVLRKSQLRVQQPQLFVPRLRALQPPARPFLSPVLFVPPAIQHRVWVVGRLPGAVRLLVLRPVLLRVQLPISDDGVTRVTRTRRARTQHIRPRRATRSRRRPIRRLCRIRTRSASSRDRRISAA